MSSIAERRVVTGKYQNPTRWEAKAILRRARKNPDTQIICSWKNHDGPPEVSGIVPYWIGGDTKIQSAWIEDMTRADKVQVTESISSFISSLPGGRRRLPAGRQPASR